MADSKTRLTDICFPKPRVFLRYLGLIFLYTFTVVWVDDHYFPHQKFLDAQSFLAGASFVIGLLLGLRANSSYDRWWEGRKLWGQLVNDSRNLAIKYPAYMGAQLEERQILGRLIVSFAYALKDHLRGIRTVTELADDKVENVPLHISSLVTQTIARSKDRNGIGGYDLLLIDTHAKALMDICGACERIKKSPIPPTYKFIIWTWLSIYLLGLPWMLTPIFDLVTIPLVLGAAYFLLAMELLADEVEDPFGSSPNDLPLDQICQTIEKSVWQVLGPQPQISKSAVEAS